MLTCYFREHIVYIHLVVSWDFIPRIKARNFRRKKPCARNLNNHHFVTLLLHCARGPIGGFGDQFLFKSSVDYRVHVDIGMRFLQNRIVFEWKTDIWGECHYIVTLIIFYTCQNICSKRFYTTITGPCICACCRGATHAACERLDKKWRAVMKRMAGQVKNVNFPTFVTFSSEWMSNYVSPVNNLEGVYR